ncbi:hypothetical protein JT238_03490, partial [Helicobacter pylori]|nr:hypothetical protein [Helicobacter pylori]
LGVVRNLLILKFLKKSANPMFFLNFAVLLGLYPSFAYNKPNYLKSSDARVSFTNTKHKR